MPRRCLGLCVLFAIGLTAALGQTEPYRAEAVKAAFIYRIAGYVEWPAEALAQPEFTIAVLGADSVAAELSRLLPQRSIKDHPARARTIGTAAELQNAQILFIGKSYVGDVRALTESVGSRPVLIMTDGIDGLEQGATVNFVSMDRRVRFEISLSAAHRAGLKIGADLLSVAARVRGTPLRSEAGCTPGARFDDFDTLCVPRLAVLWPH